MYNCIEFSGSEVVTVTNRIRFGKSSNFILVYFVSDESFLKSISQDIFITVHLVMDIIPPLYYFEFRLTERQHSFRCTFQCSLWQSELQ